MKPEEQSLIVEHAFKTEEQLRISIMMGLAFPVIREKLIRDVLGGRILATMGDTWLCTVDLKGERFALRCRSRSWPDGLWVGLQDREEGAIHLFAYWRPDNPARAALDEHLHRALCEALPEIKPEPSGGAYVWWGFLDTYKSWSAEQFLLALAGNATRGEIEGLLLRLCKAAAGAIAQDTTVSP